MQPIVREHPLLIKTCLASKVRWILRENQFGIILVGKRDLISTETLPGGKTNGISSSMENAGTLPDVSWPSLLSQSSCLIQLQLFVLLYSTATPNMQGCAASLVRAPTQNISESTLHHLGEMLDLRSTVLTFHLHDIQWGDLSW